MKRILFFMAFTFLMWSSLSALNVIVTGSVTNIANGDPIPNYAVTIMSDSASGFQYYHTVYTNAGGLYSDSLVTSTPSGILNVRVWDCNQVLHQDTCNYTLGNTFFIRNFAICHNALPCSANFSFSENPPLSVQFTDLSTGDPNGWSWNFGDGSYATTQNPFHVYAASGSYTVILAIGNPATGCYDSLIQVIWVGDTTGGNCQAQFTYFPDSVPATGYAYQFIDLSLGTPVSWLWEFGDGSPAVQVQNPVHIFIAPGTYNVCLTIHCQGIQSTWCQEVQVSAIPSCVSYFTYQQNDLQVTFNGFMAEPRPAVFSWEFGDGQVYTGQIVTHTYANPGMYYVTLTTVTSDSVSCTYSSGQTIQVGDSTQYNQVYGQVFAGGLPLTSGIAMIFSVDTGYIYLPYFDLSIIDSMGVYTFPYVPLGNYVVFAIPTDSSQYFPTYYGDVINWEDATIISLGTPVNPYNIHLVPSPIQISGPGVINGQINTTGLKAGMIDKITMLVMDEAGNALTFDRVDEAGEFGFGSMAYGIYYLHAELAGVTSEMIPVVLTEENPVVDVILTFTGNKILGINDAKEVVESWLIYPNPVSEQVNLQFSLSREANIKVEVITLTGQVMKSVSLKVFKGNNTFRMATGPMPAGIYSVRVTSPEGINLTGKFVKLR